MKTSEQEKFYTATTHNLLVWLSRARLSSRPKCSKARAGNRSFLLTALVCMAMGFAFGCAGGSKPTVPPALPSASSLPPSCTAGTAGTAYNCAIAVTNGKAPFTWTATGLPTGLQLNVSADTMSATISGTLEVQPVKASGFVTRQSASAGTTTTANVQVTVTDAASRSASVSFSIAITISPLAITTASPLPGGTAGTAYSANITATGGVTPYKWTITGLPAGLTSSSGSPSASISGTTNHVGTFSVTVSVSDSESTAMTASATLSLTIAQATTLMITTTSLPNGMPNASYSQTLAATGGVTPYSWSVSSGSLPAGLTLNANTGVISGTPSMSGTSSFTVIATDAEIPAQTATQALSITISASGLSVTTTSPLTGATLSTAYSVTVTASGGIQPYSWSVATGSTLPAGLTLASGTPSATISGTPTATGTFQFTLNVTDSESPTVTVSATFLLTVTGSSTLNCPATVNLTLCGTYPFGLRGFNSSGGPTAFGAIIVADNSGHVISGGVKSNDSVGGAATNTITGGSYVMDTSGDGRGILTIIYANAASSTFRFVLESTTNAGAGQIEQFDSSGILASGIILGPETTPVPQIAANTLLAVRFEGINGSSQRSAMLAYLQVGSSGCNGASGSLNSLPAENAVVNTAGTVSKALTITGSCTAADTNGIGTAQITISGGTPFTNATLNFEYVAVSAAGVLQGMFLLETDAIAANQPILSGLAVPTTIPAGGYNAASVTCACLFLAGGTTNGTVTTGHGVEAIVRVLTTPGTGASGTLSGVVDQNSGGTITSSGTWPYNAYTVDANGVGTITGTGATIHFVVAGDTLETLDESTGVMTGSLRPQNATTIQHANAPYILGIGEGDLIALSKGTTLALGVITPSGASSGTLAGTIDVISSTSSTAGFSASGSYSLDSTGRGTGTANLTGGTSSIAVVIYAFRGRQFAILDIQSVDPYRIGARLQ